MKCRFCGNEVEKGAKFCPVCGTEVASENNDGKEPSDGRYEDPNGGSDYGYGQPDNGWNNYNYNPSGNGQDGYNYGSSGNGQGGYNYGSSGNGQDGYNYGPSGNGQGGYNYGSSGNGQDGYNYGPSGNGQGGYGYGQPIKQISGTPYLIFSILVTICCCLPLGIVGIVYSVQINSLQKIGDYAGAEAAAKKAKLFLIIGAVIGAVVSIGLGVAGMMDSFDDYNLSSSILTEDEDDDKEISAHRKVEVSGELGDEWDSYTVQINDAVLTFPCSVDDVEATGLTLDAENTPEDYVINKNDYELVFFDDINYNSIMFVVANNTDAAKTVRECTVNGIYVDEYDVEDGNLAIIFPGGIQIGTDIEEVIDKWGEADDVYEGDYSDSYSWYDEDSSNYCSLNVDPDTKKVTTVDLDGQDLK